MSETITPSGNTKTDPYRPTTYTKALVERLLTLYDGTITENTTGAAKEVQLYKSAAILVNVTAVSGTSPTLVPTIEISPDNSAWFHRAVVIDHETEGVLTRTTAPTVEGKIQTAGKYELLLDAHLAKYIRANFVVGGTSPSFTLKAIAFLL